MGGKIGRFGLGISPDLETLDYHEDVKTFDLPALPGGSSFEIGKNYASNLDIVNKTQLSHVFSHKLF